MKKFFTGGLVFVSAVVALAQPIRSSYDIPRLALKAYKSDSILAPDLTYKTFAQLLAGEGGGIKPVYTDTAEWAKAGNATYLRGFAIGAGVPVLNQALIWNGSSWTPDYVDTANFARSADTADFARLVFVADTARNVNSLSYVRVGWHNVLSGALRGVAVGDSVYVIGDYAAAFGSYVGTSTTAEGNYSLSMGGGTQSPGDTSLSVGYRTSSGGVGSTSMGYRTEASGLRSTAIGPVTFASGRDALAIETATADGDTSVAIGVGAITGAPKGLSLGPGAKTYGRGSVAIQNSQADSGGMVAINCDTTNSYRPTGHVQSFNILAPGGVNLEKVQIVYLTDLTGADSTWWRETGDSTIIDAKNPIRIGHSSLVLATDGRVYASEYFHSPVVAGDSVQTTDVNTATLYSESGMVSSAPGYIKRSYAVGEVYDRAFFRSYHTFGSPVVNDSVSTGYIFYGLPNDSLFKVSKEGNIWAKGAFSGTFSGTSANAESLGHEEWTGYLKNMVDTFGILRGDSTNVKWVRADTSYVKYIKMRDEDSTVIDVSLGSNAYPVYRLNSPGGNIAFYSSDESPYAGYLCRRGNLFLCDYGGDPGWSGVGWYVGYGSGDQDWGPVVFLRKHPGYDGIWMLGKSDEEIDTLYAGTAVLDSLRSRGSDPVFVQHFAIDTLHGRIWPDVHDSATFESSVVNGPSPLGSPPFFKWTRTSEQAHSGTYSAGLPSGDGVTWDSTLIIRKTAAVTDSFTFWVYSVNSHLRVDFASGGAWYMLDEWDPGASWTRIAKVISNAADSFRVYSGLGDPRSSSSRLFIDDVDIIDIGHPAEVVVKDPFKVLNDFSITGNLNISDTLFGNIAVLDSIHAARSGQPIYVDSITSPYGYFKNIMTGIGHYSDLSDSTREIYGGAYDTILGPLSGGYSSILNSYRSRIQNTGLYTINNLIANSYNSKIYSSSYSTIIGAMEAEINNSTRGSGVFGGYQVKLDPPGDETMYGNIVLGGWGCTNSGRIGTATIVGYRTYISKWCANAVILGGDQDSILADAYNDDQWILGGVGIKSFNSHSSGVAGGGQHYLYISPYSFISTGKYDTLNESRVTSILTSWASKWENGDTSGIWGGSHSYGSGYKSYNIGGTYDSTKGDNSINLPGYRSRIDSSWSMTFGYRAIANRSACIMFNLDTTTACSTSNYGQFRVNAPGGVRFGGDLTFDGRVNQRLVLIDATGNDSTKWTDDGDTVRIISINPVLIPLARVRWADSTHYAWKADTARVAFDADTSLFAWHGDSTNYADTSGFAYDADTSVFAWRADTANYAITGESKNALNSDSLAHLGPEVFLRTDQADTAYFPFYMKGSYSTALIRYWTPTPYETPVGIMIGYADSTPLGIWKNNGIGAYRYYGLTGQHENAVETVAVFPMGMYAIRSRIDTFNTRIIYLTDLSEADSSWWRDNGDTTYFDSDNPMKIGHSSLTLDPANSLAILNGVMFWGSDLSGPGGDSMYVVKAKVDNAYIDKNLKVRDAVGSAKMEYNSFGAPPNNQWWYSQVPLKLFTQTSTTYLDRPNALIIRNSGDTRTVLRVDSTSTYPLKAYDVDGRESHFGNEIKTFYIYVSDTSGADSSWWYTTADSTIFDSDNPIRIGHHSVKIDTNGLVRLNGSKFYPTGDSAYISKLQLDSVLGFTVLKAAEVCSLSTNHAVTESLFTWYGGYSGYSYKLVDIDNDGNWTITPHRMFGSEGPYTFPDSALTPFHALAYGAGGNWNVRSDSTYQGVPYTATVTISGADSSNKLSVSIHMAKEDSLVFYARYTGGSSTYTPVVVTFYAGGVGASNGTGSSITTAWQRFALPNAISDLTDSITIHAYKSSAGSSRTLLDNIEVKWTSSDPAYSKVKWTGVRMAINDTAHINMSLAVSGKAHLDTLVGKNDQTFYDSTDGWRMSGSRFAFGTAAGRSIKTVMIGDEAGAGVANDSFGIGLGAYSSKGATGKFIRSFGDSAAYREDNSHVFVFGKKALATADSQAIFSGDIHQIMIADRADTSWWHVGQDSVVFDANKPIRIGHNSVKLQTDGLVWVNTSKFYAAGDSVYIPKQLRTKRVYADTSVHTAYLVTDSATIPLISGKMDVYYGRNAADSMYALKVEANGKVISPAEPWFSGWFETYGSGNGFGLFARGTGGAAIFDGYTLVHGQLTVDSFALLDTVSSKYILIKDATGADSSWWYDDGDTTRINSDNPIKIGNASVKIDTNGTVRINGFVSYPTGDSANVANLSVTSLTASSLVATDTQRIFGGGDTTLMYHKGDSLFISTTCSLVVFNRMVATQVAHSFQSFDAVQCTVAVSQGVYSLITNATNDLYTICEESYLSAKGDSIIIQRHGDYKLIWFYTFSGGNGDDHRIMVEKNGVEQAGRMTGTALGTTNFVNVGGQAYFEADPGDHIRLMVTNISNGNDPIFKSGSVRIERMPE